MKVWIFDLQGACATVEWLCGPCAEARRKVRNAFGHIQWTKLVRCGPVDGDCADCVTAAQSRPEYVTPTVEIWRGA